MSGMAGCRKIHPVLLSGGAGVRLWPMSRERFPKQLLNLTSDRSMIQETALRVADPARFARIRAEIGPLIDGETRAWLDEATRALC